MKEQIKGRLSQLIERYNTILRFQPHESISEETIRVWLNEFLGIFGWDVQNTNQVLQEHVLQGAYRQRLEEIQSTHRRPDYILKNGTNIKTFLDAKSLDVDIFTDNDAAFQIRSYGWSAQSPCAFISNFEQFVIYDTRFTPNPSQPSNMGAIQLSVDQYLEQFDVLFAHLWRQSVCSNQLESLYSTTRIEGRDRLDERFAEMLSNARLNIANDIVEHNHDRIISNVTLNYYVQVIIDRIVFIRVCESKGIEQQGKLKGFVESADGFWNTFKHSCYLEFYDHYDGAMFERDYLFQQLQMDDEPLNDFVQHLCDNGRLGYITPNNYLQGINGRSLRSFFQTTKYSMMIFDFRDTQVFKSVTSYTCITLIDSSIVSSKLLYTRKVENLESADTRLSVYNFSNFADGKPWRLCENNTDTILRALENGGKPLSAWRIRNGLATLKNDLYFFIPQDQDDLYYYRSYKGVTYRIEKAVCIDVVKPNIIKNETDLKENNEKAIFPYSRVDGDSKVIGEHFFATTYPMAYAFLSANKDLLQARDKGKGKYPEWYAYGRTQGLNNFGKKLLFPYISDRPIAVLSENENDLFYCGYALFAESDRELRLIKTFLESPAFWFYIKCTSKPYAKGYMAFAKNYIVKFSIPDLSLAESEYAISERNRQKLDSWVWSKYGLTPPET